MDDFDRFVKKAWADHAELPAEVAARLAIVLPYARDAARIIAYARLVNHVHGEHLGRWDDGVALLEALERQANNPEPAAAAAIAAAIGALRYCAGTDAALAHLAPAVRAAALAGAAATLAGRNDLVRAIEALDNARRTAPADLAAGAPATRALAVAGNNLAAALEEKRDRSATEASAMIAAAETGLRYWRLAGTWLEEERAFYQLARCQLAAGAPDAAAKAAQDCLDVCRANAAPAFEAFFGHAALARARRAQGDAAGFGAARAAALAAYEDVPEGERSWCAADLAALEHKP